MVNKRCNTARRASDRSTATDSSWGAVRVPSIDIFVLCRTLSTAKIIQAFETLSGVECDAVAVVIHILDSVKSLLIESLAMRFDFDYACVDEPSLQTDNAAFALELAKGQIAIMVNLVSRYLFNNTNVILTK